MSLSSKIAEADAAVCAEIIRLESEKKKETAAYIEGVHKGADLMYKAVKKALEESEAQQNA